MERMAMLLAGHGIVVVRFEFPYMAARREGGGRRPPDPRPRLLDCWRTVWNSVNERMPGPWAIGGKSMGGRMASLLADELQAAALVCLGYPFHAAGKPERPRVEHLAALRAPTLIVQGERDALGSRERVQGYVLSGSIRLHWLAAADHDFRPLRVSGHTHDGHLGAAAAAVADFLAGLPCFRETRRADA